MNKKVFYKNLNNCSLQSVTNVLFMKIDVPILILKVTRLTEESIFSSKESISAVDTQQSNA